MFRHTWTTVACYAMWMTAGPPGLAVAASPGSDAVLGAQVPVIAGSAAQEDSPGGESDVQVTDLDLPSEVVGWHISDPEVYWIHGQFEVERARQEVVQLKAVEGLLRRADKRLEDAHDVLTGDPAQLDEAAALIERTMSEYEQVRVILAQIPTETPSVRQPGPLLVWGAQTSETHDSIRKALESAQSRGNDALTHIRDAQMGPRAVQEARSALTGLQNEIAPRLHILENRVRYLPRVLDRVRAIRRPKQMHLSLEDVVHRTLANNYAIQTISYNPAVETTRVVEAEAFFDAVFYSNLSKSNIDRPSGSELFATDVDMFDWSTGVRKLLPSGTQLNGHFDFGRTKQAFVFQTINPEYTSNFVLDMRQPLLRGFGIDYNRSLIFVAKNNRQISDLAFKRQLRDILRQVEELYWRLVQARRDVVITAREVAEFEGIYDYLVARSEFDVNPVQVAASKADLDQARVDFVRRRAFMLNAQDRLIALMNDPEIHLADPLEVIPDDLPAVQRLVVDPLMEVQTGLDNRAELREQELRIANAKVLVGRAKNEELPRLDLTFRTSIDGLAGNADKSFDEATRVKFVEYIIGVELEVPIGNRGPRAAHHRARLEHAQAVAALRQTIEDVILDVNLAVRQLGTSFDQIGPSFESTEAREREVESIVARAERKDLNTLLNELGARRSLASIRRIMLNAMVEYNIAIADLERAKGTLLNYNNVVIPSEPD